MTFAGDQDRTGEAARAGAHQGGAASPGSLKRGNRYWYLIALPAVLMAYLASGVYIVGPDERAVVRRFGAVVEQAGPGMHYRLPSPIDQVDVVKTTSVMKVGVGFVLPSADAEVASGMELLTGDTNILNVALVLQYVIRDPTDFLFKVKDTSAFVETVAEAVLTETVAGMPIDEVLTRGRVAVQERIKEQTQEILNRRRSGISIVSASIMAMTLDRSVAQAFQDVADAMADREKMINEARAYQSNLIPKARGDARTQLGEAEAYKQQRIAEAVGGASRFMALQKEYEKARDVTRTRLYLEAMEKVLAKVQLYVIDSDKGRVPLHLRITGQSR
jgi:membrane protease subunit HflK